MQLYTINATPVRTELSEFVNQARIDKYPEIVSNILARNGIDGFTIYAVIGFWQGIQEASYKIEIATDNGQIVKLVCEELRDMYNQDAVMLTNPDNSVQFI